MEEIEETEIASGLDGKSYGGRDGGREGWREERRQGGMEAG